MDDSRRGQSGQLQLDVILDAGTLYKPSQRGSVNPYSKPAAGDLLFLQFIKALMHAPVSWKDISAVAKKAERVILIYCRPFIDEFQTIQCPDLQGKSVIVSKGVY